MKRKIINMLAVAIIGIGFAMTSMATPQFGNGGSSMSPMAKCSGGGATCEGTTCSADANGCEAT